MKIYDLRESGPKDLFCESLGDNDVYHFGLEAVQLFGAQRTIVVEGRVKLAGSPDMMYPALLTISRSSFIFSE